MTNQPLISVIIPVYNTEKYISDCLNSLISQTEKNIEILAVDDGSTDNSLKILQQYAALHSNIKVFSQKNAGPGVARNLALRKAKGKYIMFCDSDDMYKPTICQEMAQIMENKRVDFAICDMESLENKTTISNIRQKGFQIINPNLFPEIAVGIICFIFRTDVLRKYEILFPPSFYAEDVAFIYKYIFISRQFFALDKKLYILRHRADSLTQSLTKNNPKIMSNLCAIEEIFVFLKQNQLLNICRDSYLKMVEKMVIGSFAYLSEKNQKTAFMALQKILRPFSEKLENFKLLRLIENGKEKQFLRYVKTCNMSGTSKIKFCGLTIFKVKNKGDIQIYYILGLPLFKSVFYGQKRQRYFLGVRIS